jgi:hypothetical protein
MREVIMRGDLAWFDEISRRATAVPRGRGVLERDASGTWHIAQYNLALTIPNERFGGVRALLGTAAP